MLPLYTGTQKGKQEMPDGCCKSEDLQQLKMILAVGVT